MFGCAITTGFGVVENNAKLKMGESVVVFGAGGIGLNIIQAASLNSCYPIIAIDVHDNRLELAKKLGASHVINSTTNNAELEIGKILKSEKLDVFIDNTGVTKIIEKGYKLTGPFGRVVLVGVPKKGDDITIHSLPLHFGKVIIGSHGGESTPNEDIPRYLKLFNQNLWNINGIITARYPLNQINLAMDAMKKGETAGRVILSI